MFALSNVPANGATDTVVHRFGSVVNDGYAPETALVEVGTTLYGVTPNTISSGYGTVFKVNTNGGGYQILHNFGSIANDGQTPVGPLALVGSTLYGVTSGGGQYSDGAIFQINTDGSGYQIIFSFNILNSEGFSPSSPLTAVGSTLYGFNTGNGGDPNAGGIFKINTDGSGFQILRNFTGGLSDGYGPAGGLTIVGSSLYGVTSDGGTYGVGTVFKIGFDGSGYQVIYNFDNSVVGSPINPGIGLTLVGSTLYGTTYYGGEFTYGTIYHLQTDGSGFTVDHDFGGITDDGLYPDSPLTVVGSSLYGTTYEGGGGGSGAFLGIGTIYKISSNGTGYQVAYRFKDGTRYREPAGPSGGLTLVGSRVYGVSTSGGSDSIEGYGTVFSFPASSSGGPIPPNPFQGKYTLLLSSTGSGNAIPNGDGYATLVVSSNGAVAMAGRLMDGESFSATGNISAANQFVVAKALSYPSVTSRGAKGSLAGTLTFVTVTGTSDLSGSLEWTKPQQKLGAYQAPIDTNLSVIGSIYTPPAKGTSALPGFTAGTLDLSDTGALSVASASQVEQDITLTPKNALTLTPAIADKLTIALTPSTGVFKGSFIYPNKKTRTAFQGVLFQDQTLGAGFFVGPDGCGSVSLTGP
jgi:uncharacterized repeat protein (TIGR03803 family)